MAQDHATTPGALVGQGGQGELSGITSGAGRSPGQEENLLGSRAGSDGAVLGSAAAGQGQPPGQWSLASRGLARRDWAGRCVHCGGGLVVTIKTTPSGQDKCKVRAYDAQWHTERSRSRTRSPTPRLSPVRSFHGDEGLPGQSQGLDGEAATEIDEDSLPVDMDGNLLEFLGQA